MPEGPERIDYRETSDVTEVHAAIKREHGDPSADVTPIPLWLTLVCGVAILWAGAYLGVFHGGFSADVFNERDSSPALLFPTIAKKTGETEGSSAKQSLAEQGKKVYGQFCVTCHMPNGGGQPGVIPPLAGSEFVTGGEKRLIATLLKGIAGPLTVAGKSYNGAMPPWEAQLSAKKIAAVASYVRQDWGNAAPEVTEADVNAAKSELASSPTPLTEAALLQIPADASFADAPAGAAPATPAP